MSQDVPVSLVTGLREGQRRKRGSISSKGKRLLFCLNFRSGSRAFRCPNSACEAAFTSVKRLRRKIYHPVLSIAQVENECTYNITYACAFIACTKIRFPFTD